MKGLARYLDELYENCKIPFDFYVDDEKVFKTDPGLADENNNSKLENRFVINGKKCKIELRSNYKEFLKVFTFFIQSKFKENCDSKDRITLELLQNSYVSEEKINEILPYISNETYLVCISLKDKQAEALEIVKNIYSSVEIIAVNYKNTIVLMGNFEDIEEHISSISETIYTSLYDKCYAAYCTVKKYEELSKLYEENMYKINLAKKYNLSKRIFKEGSLLFEKVIDNLDVEAKKNIIEKFNYAFSKLDEDIIKTIEVFFNLDLNLSESAKALYVHRNTLIYRLDKIQKYTSYDIRKFNDAVLFKIAFFIWKEKNN